MKRIFNIIIAFGLALGSVSCVSKLAYTEPELELPETFKYTATADTASVANLEWRQFFSDPMLQTLIEKGIKNNYDLQIALKQVASSQEKLKQAKYLQYPDVGFGVSAQISKPSKNSMNGQSLNLFLGKSYVEDYNAAFNLSWEADIWGKITSKKLAAEATYLQTVAAHQAVKTQLISQVASTYYNLLALDAQKQLAQKTIENRNKSLETNKALKDAGRVTEVAVKQTEAQVLSAQALLLDIENNIKIQENSLSILEGLFPKEIERSTFADLQLNVDAEEGVSIETLNNRPDIQAAELGFRNAFELTNVAKASFYPTLKLTASGGLQSVEFEKLFDPTSFFASIVAGIAQPILNGRQIRTQYEISLSNQEKAFLNYKQSILNASKEISDALYAIDINKKKLVLKQQEAEAYTTAVNYSQELLNNGMANYLEVLTATESELNAQLNIITTQYNLWNANIQLYKAMGGGVE